MSTTETAVTKKALTTKDLFSRDDVKARFEAMLGKKTQGFITSVLQIVSTNKLLEKAEPLSIYNSAAIAATLDLPINSNLGYAWIVPYRSGQNGPVQAQFQIGWKGFVQLAQRTGQYSRINVAPVYENQFRAYNTMTEDLDADFSVDGKGKVVGYAAYFRLVTGFEKCVFWSYEKAAAHGKRFSKSFTSGPWKSDFDAMAMKCVIKETLSKWGPLSVEVNTARIADQGVVKDPETLDVEYPDNEDPQIGETKSEAEHEAERLQALIDDCKTLPDLEALQVQNPDAHPALFSAKRDELLAKEQQ